MKCRTCRGPAVIDVRRHNANFCADHFLRLCRDPSHDEAAEWAGAGFEAAQARMELLASAMNGSASS